MPEFDPKLTRRCVLIAGAASMLLFGTLSAAAEPIVTVHRDPNCGCCLGWVQHLQKAGFPTKVLETKDLDAVKTRLGVPDDLAACHTAEISGYVIEGHVPAAALKVFLPRSRTRAASRCPACQSAPPAWREATRNRMKWFCLGPLADVPTCGSSGRRLSVEIVASKRKRGLHSLGLVAIAQNPLSPSTTCGSVKPAAASVSINPVFRCPEYGVNPSAILAPPFKTRRISRNPAMASGQTCMELIANALSKTLSSNGRLSAEPCRRSTVLVVAFRFVALSTISSEGSTPATYPVGANSAASWMPTPGPKPTSRTLSFGWM